MIQPPFILRSSPTGSSNSKGNAIFTWVCGCQVLSSFAIIVNHLKRLYPKIRSANYFVHWPSRIFFFFSFAHMFF
ncbi:hypothetical protein BDV23DRAFT_145800 [Aspergillus alliaceus]|uniref:Uncharacterized protein n=1 Tax=Petromyces alliaceus TaxID=209559 RepID=A0A5N7CMA3_PETAA|nr:hypothetical protein BDV23DRAFT_145800 [Aspergillus alliaceus]